MTPWGRHLSICLLLTFLLRPAAIMAQQQSAPAPVLQSLPVYVVGFTQSDPIREIGDLGAFATGLIDLRLLEIPSLTVHRVSEPPPCETASSPNTAQSQISSNSVAPGDYYVVRGSIEVRLPEIVLDYFVEKCEKQNIRRILEDTQPFTLDHAREELTVAAHAIAYKIERATPPTPVTVELFDVEGDVPDKSEIQKSIQQEVAQALSKSSSLEVTDSSDYRIGGQITFQKNASIFRPFAKSTLQAELHIDAHAMTYPISTLVGSRDDLASQIADHAQRFLPQVLLAEHLGLREIQGNMRVDELLTRGTQLLSQCPPDGPMCGSAQDAIPLLLEVTQHNDKMWKAFSVLGQAQVLTWKYSEAVLSLEKASSLAKQDTASGKLVAAADRAQILSLLGDAYRNNEKYDQAQAAYKESLALLPSQPQLYAKKALALRLGGNRIASLEVILDGIKAYPDDPQPLRTQARDVIRVLQKDEFDKAASLFAAALGAGVMVSNEYALVLSGKWDQVLDTNWTPENRAEARKAFDAAASLQPLDPDIQAGLYIDLARTQLQDGDRKKLQTFIAAIEKLPADQVTASHREWAERINAQDYLDNNELEKATASADAALRIQATDQGNYLACTARLFLAQEKEKAFGPTPTPAQRLELKKRYREAADISTPLVLRRYAGTDTILVMASHPLGEDHKTQQQFEHLIKLNPQDVSAINALMFVCSQYLMDANCSFSTAQKLAALLNPRAPDAASDYLNIAEVAVLTSNDAVALNWLSTAAQQPQLGPRNESLVHFYRLWVELRRGQAQESLSDFQAWCDSMQRFRQTHDQLNWIFDGVKKALSHEKLTDGSALLLLAMTESFEDSNKPLPTWPKLESAAISNSK